MGSDDEGRKDDVQEEWERDALEMLSQLRVVEPLVGERELHRVVERTLDRVHGAIVLSDAGDFATEVLFGEFVAPVLDLFGFFAFGPDLEPASWLEPGHGSSETRGMPPSPER